MENASVQLPRLTSLKLNKEFKRAYYQGGYKAHPLLVSYRVRNWLRGPRVGITTGKKVGCAVRRNRAKRVIRQACRELMGEEPQLFGGFDFVFVARDKTPDSNTQEVKKVMRRQLAALKNPPPKGAGR